MRSWFLLLGFSTLGFSTGGCAPGVVYFAPNEAPAQYPLSGWPQNRLYVEVKDGRPNQKRAGPLETAVKGSIEKSLSPPIVNPGDRMSLKVTVSDLVARLKDGRWRALCRLDAVLEDEWSKRVANYTGTGEFSKADVLGRRTAELATEQALQEAIKQLLKTLDGTPMPIGKD